MDEWMDGWMASSVTLTIITPELLYYSYLYKCLCHWLGFTFEKRETLSSSVFAFSGPSIALGWWQVQQQV